MGPSTAIDLNFMLLPGGAGLYGRDSRQGNGPELAHDRGILEGGEVLSDRASGLGVPQVGSYLRERSEHEPPRPHPGMRKDELGSLEDEVVEEQQVQVERPRSVP